MAVWSWGRPVDSSAGRSGLLGRYSAAGRAARMDFKADEALVDHLCGLWPRVCEGVELIHRVDTVTGPTITTPRLVDITLGNPLVLIVKLLPGQLLTDVEAVAHRIAPVLGARRMRVTPVWDRVHVRLELLQDDPLELPVPFTIAEGGHTYLGRDEQGRELVDDWASMPHAVVQGVTRSGKSAWLYAQLAQLAARPDTLVAGSDPSGLLWRPWERHRQPRWRVSGLADVGAHDRLLQELVADMDRRIRYIPAHRDTVDLGPDTPLTVVMLEEYPGLLRAADQVDKKIGASIRSSVARLLAESHKAGYRVVLVAQRAESNVIGGFERAMCGFRLSFRVDNADSIRLLHPGLAVDRVDEHMTAPAGVALLTAPGTSLVRLRGPWIGGFERYSNAVRTAV